MVFKVLAFVVFIGLADSYGIPWFQHAHDDCENDYPHYHSPSAHVWNHPPPSHEWNHPPPSHGWNHPPSSHGWDWHPWHKPHLITTYSPLVVYVKEDPTTTEVATEEPEGSINVSSSGSGVISTDAAEDDSANALSNPQESDSASSEVSTTEPPTTTTAPYKVKPLEPKPDYYYKSHMPVHEGKYIAKTRGSVHIAPLQGHASSVTALNIEPAPGTV